MTAIIELDEAIDHNFEMPPGLINQVPLEEGAKKILAEFRIPMNGKMRRPYILFAKNGYRSENQRTTRVWSPFMLPLDGCFCSPATLQYYIRKGFTVIKYWIPPLEERKKYRDARIGYSDRGEDVDHFQEMQDALDELSSVSPHEMSRISTENERLKAELLELREGKKNVRQRRAESKERDDNGPIS